MMATAQLHPNWGSTTKYSMHSELAGTVGMVSPDYNQPSANRGINRPTTHPMPTEGKSLASHPPPTERTVASRPPPRQGELPCYPSSADRVISRLTTIPQSTILIGLLCCAEFQVAASEGAKNDMKSCDRQCWITLSLLRHVHCSLLASPVVAINTGKSSRCDHHCTSRSCPPSRCDHHIVAVVPFWSFDGAIITAGVRGWHTLCVVVDMKQKQSGTVSMCNRV